MRRFARSLCALIFIGALMPTAVAHAGTYVIRSCNVPGQPGAPAAGWSWFELAPGMYANDDCASGSGFGINAGPMLRATRGVLGIQTPTPELTIRQVRVWMVARLTGSGSGLFITAHTEGASGLVRQDLFGPPGGDTLRDPYVTPPLAPDTTRFSLLFSCTGGTPDGCAPNSAAPLEIRGAEVVLYEGSAPRGSIGGGALLAPGRQSGVRALGYTASDSGSGVAQVTALLGNTVVGSADTSDCTYSGFAACPLARSGSLQVDTRKVSDGIHPLLVRITDAAGNREAIQAAGAIEVANGVANEFAPDAVGAIADARLSARFVGRTGESMTVSHGKRVAVQGRLVSAAGRAIGGATLMATEAVRGSRAGPVERAVVTRADGSFRYTMARHGASRTLRFSYRPAPGGAVVVSERLRVRVRASATLRVGLRGTLVTYSGRLVTRPVPTNGKLLQVEGRAAGGAWTAFARKRTSRSGEFAGRYRLRVRRPGVRLQFRVRIPTQADYPYAAGTGRVVTRTVR